MHDGTNIVNALPAFHCESVALFLPFQEQKGELIDFTSDAFAVGVGVSFLAYISSIPRDAVA